MKLMPLDEATGRMMIGGKGLGLLSMREANVAVPETHFLAADEIAAWLHSIGADLTALHEADSDDAARVAALDIQSAIVEAVLPEGLLLELQTLLDRHGRIIFRSSASAEDGRLASLAGHFESVVACARSALAEAFLVCLSSFFEEHCIAALRRLDLLGETGFCVIVQEFVPPAVAGVSFTASSSTGSSVYSEVCFGFGRGLVEGSVTPQRVVDSELECRDIRRLTVARALTDTFPRDVISIEFLGRAITGVVAWIDESAGLVALEQVQGLRGAECLTAAQISEVERVVRHLRRNSSHEIDVEWLFAESGELVVVQVRPVTARIEAPRSTSRDVQVAAHGAARGPARVILSPAEAAKVDQGAILVVRSTDPRYMGALLAASGVIAEEGGLLCHSAIVARELGIPCLLNVQGATRRFKHGMDICIDTSAHDPISVEKAEGKAKPIAESICRIATNGGALLLGAEGLTFECP